MLVIGERLQTVYHEADLLRMFRKSDVNGDKLIDLNEFLHMQLPTGGGQKEGVGVHPHRRSRERHGAEAQSASRRW